MTWIRAGVARSNRHQHTQMLNYPFPWVPGLGFMWRCRVLYSDFSDADTSEVLNLTTLAASRKTPKGVDLPTNIHVTYAAIDLIELFDGGSISDMKAILGIDGDTNGYVEQVDIGEGETTGVRLATDGATLLRTFVPDPTPLLQLDATGGNMNAMTAGKLDALIFFTLPPDIRTA